MTTAEKRAQLEAEGQPWPDCDCHGEPYLWQKDTRERDGGRWFCRITSRQRRNAWRAQRVKDGQCARCGGPLATELYCRPCADKHADLMATPKQRMLHQIAGYRHKNRQKDFQSTGAGLAAAAAHLTNRGG